MQCCVDMLRPAAVCGCYSITKTSWVQMLASMQLSPTPFELLYVRVGFLGATCLGCESCGLASMQETLDFARISPYSFCRQLLPIDCGAPPGWVCDGVVLVWNACRRHAHDV